MNNPNYNTDTNYLKKYSSNDLTSTSTIITGGNKFSNISNPKPLKHHRILYLSDSESEDSDSFRRSNRSRPRSYSTDSDSYGVIGSDVESVGTDYDSDIEELIHNLKDEDEMLPIEDMEEQRPLRSDKRRASLFEDINPHSKYSLKESSYDEVENFDSDSDSDDDSESDEKKIKSILDQLEISEEEPENYSNIEVEYPEEYENEDYEDEEDEEDDEDDEDDEDEDDDEDDEDDDNVDRFDDRIIEIHVNNYCDDSESEIVDLNDFEFSGGGIRI